MKKYAEKENDDTLMYVRRTAVYMRLCWEDSARASDEEAQK